MTKTMARIVLACAVFFGTWTLIQSRSLNSRPLKGVADARGQESEGMAEIDVGEQLCPPAGEHWPANSNSGTLVIVTDPHCAYCDEERPFHDQLYASAESRGLAAVYVIGKDKSQNERVTELLKAKRNVWRTFAAAVGIFRTPALVLVDSLGNVTAKWIGGVPSERTGDVLSALLLGESYPRYGEMDRNEFVDSVAKNASPQLLVLKETEGGIAGARYIPFDELAVRGAYELKHDRRLYVDCLGLDKFSCQRALTQLSKMDFPEVVGIGLKKIHRTCPVKP